MDKKNLLFLFSMFFSRLADTILLFLVPLIIYKITKSASISGFVFFMESLPRFLWFPIAGILTSYISSFNLLNISQVMRFVVVILGLMGYFLVETYYWLILISAIVGMLTTQGDISREVIIVKVFKKFNIKKVFSITQLSDQVGIVLAPLLAILLLNFTTWETIVFITSILFLISDLCLKLWLNNISFLFKIKTFNYMEIINDLKTTFFNILTLPKLIPLILLSFSINLVLGALLSSVVPIFTGVFNQSQNSYAMLQFSGVLTTIIVLLTISKFAFSLKSMGIISCSLIFIGAFFTTLDKRVFLYIIGYILIIGFDKMFNIFSRTYRLQIIPQDDFGKTIGWIILFNNIAQPIAGLIIGLYADILGIQCVLLYICLGAFLLGISVIIKSRIC